MVCTEEIFVEYIETIERLTEKSGRNVGKEIEPLLIENLEFIENKYFDSYSRDPEDDKFINCAKSGNIPYIISGDKDLLVLLRFGLIGQGQWEIAGLRDCGIAGLRDCREASGEGRESHAETRRRGGEMRRGRQWNSRQWGKDKKAKRTKTTKRTERT